jgi:hypothetical protein
MNTFEIIPLVGVGAFKLGMHRSLVKSVFTGEIKSYYKSKESIKQTDSLFNGELQIYYDETESIEFMELSTGTEIKAIFQNKDIFKTNANELIQYISQITEFDKNDPELGYSYVFKEIQMSLWRPSIPVKNSDETGNYFATVGIGRDGYY